MTQKGKPSGWIYLGVVSAMLMWSMTFIWFKIVNEELRPLTIVFLRTLISSIILLLIALVSRRLEKVKKGDWKYFLLLSLFNPIIYFIAESLGLSMLQATLGAVIVSTIPLLVPVGAYFFLKERLSWLNILGMFISFSGVLVVILKRNFTFNAPPAGVLLMFVAVLAAVGYTLLVKRMTARYNAYSITTWQNLIAALIFIPMFLIFELDTFQFSDIGPRTAMNLVYLAVFGSCIAFILFNTGVKELGAARADFFSNIIPVLTAVFAFFILGEELGLQKIIGILIVLTGLVLSQLRRPVKRSYRRFLPS